MAQRRAIAQLVLKKKFQSILAKKFFDRAFIAFYSKNAKAIMSTNNSRDILACRRQVLSRGQ